VQLLRTSFPTSSKPLQSYCPRRSLASVHFSVASNSISFFALQQRSKIYTYHNDHFLQCLINVVSRDRNGLAHYIIVEAAIVQDIYFENVGRALGTARQHFTPVNFVWCPVSEQILRVSLPRLVHLFRYRRKHIAGIIEVYPWPRPRRCRMTVSKLWEHTQ